MANTKRGVFILAVLLAGIGWSREIFAALLQPSDLVYQGAFLVPTTDFFAEFSGNLGWPNTSALTFNPDGNGGSGSLFMIGRAGRVAEITVPTPKMSGLSTASVLQSNTGPFSYGAALDNDATSGIAYMSPRGSQTSPKLYFGSFEYYNVDVSDYNSLGWANTTLSNAQTAGLWHVGPNTNDQSSWSIGPKHGEYLFSVPQSWADTYVQGRSLFIGRMREGGNSGGSKGPVLTAVAPWASGNPPVPGTALSATPLVSFGGVNWSSWRLNGDPDWTYFSGGDRVTGGAFIDRGGKRAVLLGMRHGTFDNCPVLPEYGSDGAHGGFCLPTNHPEYGTEPYCYGDGGTECPWGVAITNNKGYANGPYMARLAFIDIADLEAVAQGTKSYSAVGGYAVYNLMNDFGRPSGTQLDRVGANDVTGVAYDEARGLLYVGQSNGNDPNGHPNPAWPVIHVYSISGTPDTTPPTSPTNLAATAPSSSSISVSWTAATDNVAVTGYIVERCQGSGCSNFVQIGTPTASPFVDTGLTPNTFYNYHVRATDAAGNLSGWSNVVGATTQAPDTTPPSAPSSLSATVVSSSNITLAWTASTDNVAVTGYRVERCSGSGCTNFVEVGTPSTNSYSDTGLSSQTLYRYRVRATDAANNNSGYSNISEGTTPQAPPTPTFVAEYETAWNSATSPKTTSNFSVQTGDILVAYAVNESSGSAITTPPAGTLTGAWTLRQTISATDYTALRLWTMQVATNQTNVNVSFSNAGGNFGGNILHFRNASSVGVTAQANSNTGNPTLTVNGVFENSSIIMVNGDWSARTGARTYNTGSAGTFTETSYYADGTSYGVEAGYYANAGTAGNKTIGLTAPTGMKWALAAVEVKGNPTTQSASCNTVTTANFSQAAYNSYGAPFDAFQTSVNLMNATCTSTDTHTVTLTTGITGDTTRIVYTKGYWYDPVTTAWRQYTGACTGAQNGEWCQGSVSATITDPNVSTASSTTPTYLVGMTCSVQGGGWKCGCRDTTCANFSWQVQGAGM